MCIDKRENFNKCVEFFKNDKAFNRLFQELLKKWKKHEGLVGYIILEGITSEEREKITEFLKKTFSKHEIKFKAKDFERALKEAGFEDIIIKELLEAYFDEALITNKELKRRELIKKQNFFDNITDKLKADNEYSNPVKEWIENMLFRKIKGYALVISEYEKSEDNATYKIINVCKAINLVIGLNDKKISIIGLGKEIAGDPDYFNQDNIEGKMLIYALSSISNCDYPKDSEKLLELYYASGIGIDSISSYTSVYGISLYNEKGIHNAYSTFISERESYVITLTNLKNIVKADSLNKNVFIIESQKLFFDLCNYFKNEDISLICTSGQLKTATLVLIDLLCKSDNNIFYSGNFSPEGITTADRLIKRTDGKAGLYCYELEDYAECITEEEINFLGLKQLERVQSERLKKISEEIIKCKKIGRHELLFDKILNYIKLI